MAINYTYPVKGSPSTADEFLIIDSIDNSTKKVTVANVLALGGGGSGGTGTVSEITFDAPLTGGIITTTGTVGLGVVGVDNGGTGKDGLLSSNRSQVLAVNAGRTGYDFVDQQVIETIEADEPLSKGDPLYVVGWNNGTSVVIVGKADSSQGSKMPCVGVAANNIAEGAVGEMIVVGVLDGIATNNLQGSPSVGDVVYVRVGGGFTGLKPDQGNLIQNIGIILNSAGAGAGSIQITATGRSNDIPNIPSANVWIGSSNQVATPRAFSGEVSLSNTGVTAVTSIAGNVSIQGYSPIVTKSDPTFSISTDEAGKTILFTNGGTVGINITDSSGYPVGSEVQIVNFSSGGNIEVAAGGGTTLTGGTEITQAYGSGILKKAGTNSWVFFGQVA